MLFISPPFGNYLTLPNTISIKGSFTINERPGLLLQIIKTLRYSLFYEGWINKIGLRNKGIININTFNSDSVYSIAIMDSQDIQKFNDKIPENTSIEINISCPNVTNKLMYNNIDELLNNKREWCIVKLSPTVTEETIDSLYDMGFRQFHCCNTFPTKKGGVSGKYLKQYVTKHIKYIKNTYKDTEVIAGGGIISVNDIEYYKSVGADHFSVSTVLFNPFLFSKLYYDYSKYTQIY